MDKANFSKWLQAELDQRGWNQADLARKSGVSTGQIARLMSGERGLGEDSVTAIAKALHTPVNIVYRAAGFLPQESEADEMVEKLNYKISQLTPGARALAEKLLDALLEEDVKKIAPLGKQVKSAR